MLMLQSLALQAQGDTAQALTTLTGALTLAEAEGYIRLFVDEGARIAALLYTVLEAQRRDRVVTSYNLSIEYISKLLSAFGLGKTGKSKVHHPKPEILEPLSARELEVLRLIAAGLSNKAIAKELVVSAGTIKTHINNIYGKLNVRSRTQAVARARELKIV
jgi:LuxR family maltose regulon positive regulatory protein